jgi:hypothetical protein
MSADPTVIPGDPGGLIGLGSQLMSTAERVSEVGGQVTANELPGWAGVAGDAFRSSLQTFPGELSQARSALQSAGQRVRTFGQDLEGYQYTARTKAQQIAQNKADQQVAQTRADAAKTKVDAATAARDATTDPISLKTAHKVLDAAVDLFHTAGSALQSAVDEGEALLREAEDNFQRYLQAAEDVAGEIEGALGDIVSFVGRSGSRIEQLRGELDRYVGARIHAGEQRVKHIADEAGSGLEHAWHDTEHFGHAVDSALAATGKTIWHVAKGFGTGVYHAATAIPGDVSAIYHDPTNLHDWSKLAEDTGTVAGAVALVAAAVVFLPEEGALAGVAADAAVVGDVAGTVGTVSMGVQTEADIGSVAQGQESWHALARDAVDIGLSKVDIPGTKGADDDVDALTSQDQTVPELDSGQRKLISDGADAVATVGSSATASSAEDALSAAEQTKRAFELANQVKDHLIVDPLKDKAEQAVHLTDPDPVEAQK